MFGPLDVLEDVSRRLESAEIEYFLVGSLASMFYSRPRFTNDIDLVVQIKPSQATCFADLFGIDDYYCPPREIIADEIVRSGSFNLIHHNSGVKIDIVLMNSTPFYESEFERRRRVELTSGLETYIASPEDIIIKKLDYYREGGSKKHLEDVRAMLIETEIDRSYLSKWIQKLGLSQQWNEVE